MRCDKFGGRLEKAGAGSSFCETLPSLAVVGSSGRPPSGPSSPTRHQPDSGRSGTPSQGTTTVNMHLRGIGLLTLGAAVADAFIDTSPFILASTSEYVLVP